MEDLDTGDVEEICHQILDGITPPDKESSKAPSSANNAVSSPVRMRTTTPISKKSPITRLTSSSSTERSPIRSRTTPQTTTLAPSSANVPPVVRRTTAPPQTTLVSSAMNVPSTVKTSSTTTTERSTKTEGDITDAILPESAVSQVPNPPASHHMLPIQGLNIYNHPPPNHAPPPNLMMMQQQSYDARISHQAYHSTSNQSSATAHGGYHYSARHHPGYQYNVSHKIFEKFVKPYVNKTFLKFHYFSRTLFIRDHIIIIAGIIDDYEFFKHTQFARIFLVKLLGPNKSDLTFILIILLLISV